MPEDQGARLKSCAIKRASDNFAFLVDNLDIREYNQYVNSIFEIRRSSMPRLRYQTLTEQMFYVLLCLTEERCGMDMLQLIPEMTEGRVNIGSGTLYDLLEQFLDDGLIRETKREGRRRSYKISGSGIDLLKKEYSRISAQIKDYEKNIGVYQK